MKKFNLIQIFLILICFMAFTSSTIHPQIETKLTASDGEEGNTFGESVAIDGDYLVVGASLDNDNGKQSGSVYIFKRSGASWNQEAKLIASDGAAFDEFGISVSISGDYVVVGAWKDDDNGDESGSAYIFRRNGTSWSQQAKLIASDGAAFDRFGVSVSIGSDYLVVGAFFDDDNGDYSGSTYIFKRDGTSWSQEAKLTASDGTAGDMFGYPVFIRGNYLMVGAFGDDSSKGSAYVFERDDNSWSEQAKLTASDGAEDDGFGYSVSINGNYAVVGAPGEDDNGDDSGSAYIFKRDGSSWSEVAKLLASDGAAEDIFGWSVSISGDYVVVGAPSDDDNGVDSGSAYLYLLNISPKIISIKDVPHDQGGHITIKWQASSLDKDVNTLFFYSIWRALPEGTLSKFSAVSAKDITRDFTGAAYRLASLNGKTYAWEWLAHQPAHCFEQYSYTAATLYDSMSTTDGKHYFLVSAHTNDPNVFYDSNVDSGYSVDNLPPLPPAGLIASVIENKVELNWNESPETDLAYYVIYRDGSRYDSTSHNSFTDANVEIGKSYFYKLTAADIHENESAFSEEVSSGPVPVELVSFTASVNSLTITLSWGTASESNNYGFAIQRRADSAKQGEWRRIGFVKGHGTTSSTQHYQYVDKLTTEQITNSTIYHYRLKQIDTDGSFCYSQVITVTLGLPEIYHLSQNYPNPFNLTTTIGYAIPGEVHVQLMIYDIRGRLITTLVDRQQTTGWYNVQWDGVSHDGKPVSSGVYLVRLQAGGFVGTNKILLMK